MVAWQSYALDVAKDVERNVFDTEGRYRSLQQTVSMFLDENAIADATVKVA